MAASQKVPSDELHCVLCCDEIEFSACGVCDHSICLKCCLKLRMLRKEHDCPVCRAQLKEVIVSKGYKNWADKSVKPRAGHMRNFGIYHEHPESQRKVDELLQHMCQECGEVFKSFPLVKDHLRKVHMRYYCDICLRNLKIFTHERKCYTREDLVKHRKQGDADDKSHRGHPLCRFCDDRYLDDDELLLHLRKNHFWCHLCEKDGRQDYFPQYNDLRKHFGECHFLCEEGMCLHEKLTSVFRTKIDYQAHKAQQHLDKLSKAEARQIRQLDIDITFVPRQTDSINVVSSRDYSFPEQRSDRYGGRKSGSREGTAGSREGTAGRASGVGREGNISRQVKHMGRERGGERVPTRDTEDKKWRDRDSGLVARGTPPHGNVRDGGRSPRNAPSDKRGGGDSERTSKDTPHNRRGDEGASRDTRDNRNENWDSERASKDEVHGKKSKNLSQREQGFTNTQNTATMAGNTTPGNSAPGIQKKKYESLEKDCIGGENDTNAKEEPVKNVPVHEQPKSCNGQTSVQDKPVGPSQKSKASSKFHDDFPALSANVTPSVRSCDEQYSKLSINTKKNPVVTTAQPTQKRSYHEEFPTLATVSNGHVKSNLVTKAPPGLARPMQPRRPPPGLTWNIPPSMASSGPSAPGTSENSPRRAVGKDKQLIEQIHHILDHREQSFSAFKEISGQFRNGFVTAENYYNRCCELLGEENIHKVFRKLIDILPDNEKQSQLLSVYNDVKIQAKQGTPRDAGSSAKSEHKDPLVPMVSLHEDFPALPKSSGKKSMKAQQNMSGAWVHGR